MKKTTAKRDLAEWDREIEADFQRAVASRHKRKKVEPFVVVPLWWIAQAARLTRSPTTLVLIELLYAAWKARSSTFTLPNGRLKRLGVSRKIKSRVLCKLETGKGRLIIVKRRIRKTPMVTLTVR
jgi:hypothetical protein